MHINDTAENDADMCACKISADLTDDDDDDDDAVFHNNLFISLLKCMPLFRNLH